MFETWMDLVFELLAVNGGAASAGARGIASLEHEIGDYAVEENVVVIAAACELRKVFASLRARRLEW